MAQPRSMSIRPRSSRFASRVLYAVVASLACLIAAPAAATETSRLEIVLDANALPGADRERVADRQQAIDEAIASGMPLWRSSGPAWRTSAWRGREESGMGARDRRSKVGTSKARHFSCSVDGLPGPDPCRDRAALRDGAAVWQRRDRRGR
jgi:hypothetical protein